MIIVQNICLCAIFIYKTLLKQYSIVRTSSVEKSEFQKNKLIRRNQYIRKTASVILILDC